MGKNYRKNCQMPNQKNRSHHPEPPLSEKLLAIAYEKPEQE